jgi:nicotinamide-nucleotide amidase
MDQLQDASAVRETLRELVGELLAACQQRKLMLTTAESCTGGMVAAALTAVAGSSAVYERGFVTYSNEAKTEILGVAPSLLEKHGAVSEPVARAMAEGAIAHSRADIAISVTGIAGPGGGTAEKPVGLVHFATARRDGATLSEKRVFAGDRDAIRLAAVAVALRLIVGRLA